MRKKTSSTIRGFLTRHPSLTTALGLFLLLVGTFGHAAFRQSVVPTTPFSLSNDNLWTDLNSAMLPTAESTNSTVVRSARTLRLNRPMLEQTLRQAPLETKGKSHETLLSLPLPDGGFAQFRLENSTVLPPALAAKYPQLQSYRGESVGVKGMTMRCDWSPRGLHATILRGEQLISVHPLNVGDTQHYVSVYDNVTRQEAERLFCQVKDNLPGQPRQEASLPAPAASLTLGAVRRTYRIAIATTQEYTNAPTLGGGSVTSTLASITTFINAANVIYERELSIRFVLATNNDQAIYTAEPDPFTNGDTAQMLTQVTAALKAKVGASNYDLGHVLGTGGGGVAGVGVVCQGDDKSLGVSLISTSETVGTGVSLITLLHEIGHQFNATHTFSAECSGNRNDATAYESASGLTLMSYGGVCSPAIVTSASTHFHSHSINQILSYITNAATGGSCAVTTVTGNAVPAVNPGIAYTIPKQTPFQLTATGSDADASDVPGLTYSWEQVDAGPTPPYTSVSGPLFRPFIPSTNPTRTFPSLTYILNDANIPPGTLNGLETAENLPAVARTMNFNCVVRDLRGGVASEAVTITAADSGPFLVTQPNSATTWAGNSTQTVTWSVNGTNAAPVNCANVRILLSVDGGLTFPYVLSNSTANTGTATVTAPTGLFSSKGRIKVEAIGNVFFDISDANFAVTPGDGCPAISGITPLIGNPGTNVTITGVNFTGVTKVTFGGDVESTSFTIDSDTQITAPVPSGAVSGFITITKDGCSAKQTNSFSLATGATYSRSADDGSVEAAFAATSAGAAYYVNRLTPLNYPATVTTMLLYIPDSVPIGTELNLLVGTNPSGGSTINGATFQATPYITTTNNQFVNIPVPNVTITSGDLLIGISHVPAPGVFPVGVDNNSTLRNRSYFSSDGGANFTLLTTGNFAIRAFFVPGAICSSGCNPSPGNTAPIITPAAAVTRQRGSAGTNVQVATVSDNETAANAINVTATTIPPGIFITNLANNNGVVTATIDADCSATVGNNIITFTASDGALNSTGNFTVNVLANTAPVIASYSNTILGRNTNGTITPSAAPVDNGTIASIVAASPTFAGTFTVNPNTGVISVTNANPLGLHTVTVTATDNCAATSTTSFQINVVTPILISSISPTTVQAKSSGFTLTVNGSGFTSESKVRWNGADRTTTFISATQLQATIPASDIDLSAAGSASITVFDASVGGITSNTHTLTITAPNPVPAITSLNPSSVLVGGATFTLLVNGTGFMNGSVVRVNGIDRTTTFVNDTQLSIEIAASEITSVGTRSITVFNPTPGGGTSGAATLSIVNPTPGALTLNPASVVAGAGATMVTVTGTNFRADSVGRVNGNARTTAFVSATELKVTLTAADVANATTLKLTVFTPEPGGGTSPEANFTVNNPAPTLTSLSPASATSSGADFTLTINGTNFVSTSQVKFNGNDRTTTFVSATQLTIVVTAADIANAGSATITVVNPTPGGGTSNQLTLPINNPAPTLTNLSPSTVLVGSAATVVTLTGTGFRANSVVRVNGSDRATTIDSATQLKTTLSTTDLSAPGILKISVSTPTPGGGTTTELDFTVGNPVPALTTLNPTSVNAGSAAFTLTINGTGFVNGAQVKFNGADRTTTFVSATQLTIALTASDVASPGSATIAVVNPAPGGGTSGTVNFPINNPTPGTISLNPASALVGSGATTVTVTGTGFTASSVIRIGGADRATTFVSETQLTTQLTALELANAGTLKFTVNTPPPGGGLSPEATFTINNPAPNLTSLSPASVLTGAAAFTLTINGTGFVSASQARVNGADRATTFVSATQLTIAITAAEVTNPGSLAITVVNTTPGGGTSSQLNLPINHPAPTLSSISPNSVLIGSATTMVTLTGTDFRANSVVRVNGTDRATTFVSATQLQVTFTAAELVNAATLKLTVFTPTPGGGTSAELNFVVGNPVPAITTLTPANVTTGGSTFTLVINGTGFISGSQVKYNGTDRATNFVTSTQLTIEVTAADIATPSTATIAVVNSAPGGGTSNTVNLPINNPAPGAITLSPSSVTAGNGNMTLTINGSDFRSASVVRVNGTDRTTTFVSATQLTIALTAAELANAGTLKLTVSTPAPGGGVTPEATFTINNPAPTLTSLNPTTVIAGGPAFTLTINGTGFVPNSTVKVNPLGLGRQPTFVSSTQLTLNISEGELSNPGFFKVSVINDAPGGGTSNELSLPINSPAPTLVALSQTTVPVGSLPLQITVTGSNFRQNSIVRVNGSDRGTTYVSATELKFFLANVDLATAGTLSVTVFTPEPGGGSSSALTITVNNLVPTISALNPNNVAKGDPAFTLTVVGTNFINSSIVRWNGSDRATTFVSATQLQAAIPASDIAAEGNANVTVFTPTPGGGTSSAVTFTIRPAGYEGDVAPRPNGSGNGTVTIADWTQVGRFVAGLDTPDNGSEFQRADVAPRANLGDGRITVADWVQTGRYAAGLDTVVGSGGPNQPVAALETTESSEMNPRVVRALNGNWQRGQVNTMRIELDAQGNENAIGFSLEFDPQLLSFVGATAENGATLTINQQRATQGRVGFIVALPAGQQFVVGTRAMLQVRFVPMGGSTNATTTIRFSDQIIRRELADTFANVLTGTSFVNAEATISGRATAHVSAASYVGNEGAADSIVSAFGTELATMTVVASVSPLPTFLGGTRVIVKDSAGVERNAPLFFVSPSQVNYLIPAGTTQGLASVTITNGSGVVSYGVVTITRTAPGLFSADASGKGFAAANVQRIRANGSEVYEPVSRFDSTRGQFVGVPIALDDGAQVFLALYGTGWRNHGNLSAIQARMGGVAVEVLYAGPQGQYAGLDQINLRVPRSLAGRGEVNVELSADGRPMNVVKVQVK